jgi:hypothetical protein
MLVAGLGWRPAIEREHGSAVVASRVGTDVRLGTFRAAEATTVREDNNFRAEFPRSFRLKATSTRSFGLKAEATGAAASSSATTSAAAAGMPAVEVIVPPDRARGLAVLLALTRSGAVNDESFRRVALPSAPATLEVAPIVIAPIPLPDDQTRTPAVPVKSEEK